MTATCRKVASSSRIPAQLAAAALLLAACGAGCGKGGFEYDKNLIVNGSFEDVGVGGIPRAWKLLPFRGGEGQSEVLYGVAEGVAQDGARSWTFRADPGTRRFHHLAQEVVVPDEATHVRITGWIQLEDVQLRTGQNAHCNFLLTFFDATHNRFQGLRVADRRTPLRDGAQLWTQEDMTFRLPKGTRYVQLSCVLGMNGRAWFDDLTLSVPKPIPWEESTTKNFVFHSLPGHPMPAGSKESQQVIFDAVAARLGVTTDVVIQYYFYPDSSTIRSMLGIQGHQFTNWDEYEFHSINPNDDHEVVHFITDPMGRPPRAIAEGTVFWLRDEWAGRPLDEAVAPLVRNRSLPGLRVLLDYNLLAMEDPGRSMPAAASFVSFIVDRWGTPKLLNLYTAANGVNSADVFALAFEQVYEVPLAEVETAWRNWLLAKYGRG